MSSLTTEKYALIGQICDLLGRDKKINGLGLVFLKKVSLTPKVGEFTFYFKNNDPGFLLEFHDKAITSQVRLYIEREIKMDGLKVNNGKPYAGGKIEDHAYQENTLWVVFPTKIGRNGTDTTRKEEEKALPASVVPPVIPVTSLTVAEEKIILTPKSTAMPEKEVRKESIGNIKKIFAVSNVDELNAILAVQEIYKFIKSFGLHPAGAVGKGDFSTTRGLGVSSAAKGEIPYLLNFKQLRSDIEQVIINELTSVSAKITGVKPAKSGIAASVQIWFGEKKWKKRKYKKRKPSTDVVTKQPPTSSVNLGRRLDPDELVAEMTEVLGKPFAQNWILQGNLLVKSVKESTKTQKFGKKEVTDYLFSLSPNDLLLLQGEITRILQKKMAN